MGSARAGLMLGVVALLMLPGVDAWSQLHGDAARSGIMSMPEGPLDVVGYHRLLPETENFNALQGPTLVPSPHGYLGVARVIADESCLLIKVSEEDFGAPSRTPLHDCHAPWLQGYDPRNDLVFLCNMAPASGPVFQARNAVTGELVWSIVPIRDLGVVDSEAALQWGCTGAAFDLEGRRGAVVFANFQTGLDIYRHRIAYFDLDTAAIIWTTQVPRTSEFTGGTLTGQPADVEGPAAGLIPLTITMTATGLLATGVLVCADIVTCDQPTTNEEENFGPFMTSTAWTDLDGRVQGMASSRFDYRSDELAGDATARTSGGAFWAAASGSLAAVSAGGYITIVNPENQDWLASAPVSSLEAARWGVDPFASPIWGRDSIFVPFYRTLTAFDPMDLTQLWAWSTDESGWVVGDAVVSEGGSVMVLASETPRTTQAGIGLQSNKSVLVRIEGASGLELQRLPITAETWMTTEEPFGIPESGREDFRYPRPPNVVPLDDGILVVDMSGNLVELRSSVPESGPTLRVNDWFPAPGVPVVVTVPRVQDGASVVDAFVRWGDGTTDRLSEAMIAADEDFVFRHAFGLPQRHELLVTATYADGRTGTTTAVLDVGGSPPPELNAFQKAFARENQDLLFGVLGIVLALSGALWAAHVRHRRRGWLRRKLAELDQLAERHRDRPAMLRATLEEEREAIRQRALEGRLEDASLGLLERRIDALASAARLDVLEHELDFLPYALIRRVQDILRDNRVDEAELAEFISAMERESDLSLDQRLRVERIIATWYEEDTT